MTFRTLLRRSLRFYWRSHLGVVLGAAIGSAALIGALIVGDSVKGSLRRQALLRLGLVEFALDCGDRTVTEELDSRPRLEADGAPDRRLSFDPGQDWPALTKTVLRVQGTASHADGTARANKVSVYGVPQTTPGDGNSGFPPPSAVWKWPGLLDAPPLSEGEAWINQQLAQQLKLKVGDSLLLRLPKRQALSLEAPVSARSGNTIALRLKVARILDASRFADFDLRSQAAPPFNAFVNLKQLQRAMQMEGRANLVLCAGMLQDPANPIREKIGDSLARMGGGLAPRFHEGVGTYQPHLQETASVAGLLEAGLQQKIRLADYEASLRATTDARALELVSQRVFLDPPLVRSALAAAPDARPILTYLANLIAVGSNAAPYSMVAAAGAPWAPPGLLDDQIILNQWLADDLQAKPGDAVTLVYFDPESGARLIERTNAFRVHSIVPMEMPWADRTLMPQFPGIEKAETTAEWDTAFPLVHKIRPQDDDYWRDHRGTPKAFITLVAGQKMWGNRFGNLTAIRFPVAAGILPAVATGFQPGGSGVETTNALNGSNVGPDGKMPPSTSGKMPGATFQTFRVALEKKILASVKPGELGLRFEPVREQALTAAGQSQDFGGLIIGFSMFVIAAALLLMALLFQFSLEQRATEVGTLLALGFTPQQVRRLLLREGAALAFLGGLLGTAGGIGYARAMLHGLGTIWRAAVGASTLQFFVTAQTLFVGLLASTLVAVFTIWLALRRQARQPARELLAGEAGGGPPAAGGAKRRRGALVAAVAALAAVGLVAWPLAKGDTANAGAFFGAGALVLLAGLSFLNTGFSRRSHPSSILHPPSSSALALRGLARRRSRSVATVALLASGTFLIVSIGVFRLDADLAADRRTSGTGGFALIGESTLPVVADLNTKAGRESFALDEADFTDVKVVPFRVRAGDEASCLNLNRAQKPRLLGVRPPAMDGRFTFAKGAGWAALSANLHPPSSPGEVPAIGDAASIQWAMGRQVGDTLDYVDELGQPFKVRLVGAVANSILQGQLIIDEAEFVRRFPGESGYKSFLIDAPTNRVADVSARLSRALQDVGLEVTPAPLRLAQFNAVQNTYLGTFQILGGLGLLLGSAGLGIVVLRNVLERRGELAVLLAVGWRPDQVRRLVLQEHAALLALGMLLGLAAACVAVLPSVLMPRADFPWLSLGLTLGAVVANGVAWTWLASRFALRGDLLAALRNE